MNLKSPILITLLVFFLAFFFLKWLEWWMP